MATPLAPLILDQLVLGESRLLTLVVAIRKALGPDNRIKGDLSTMVKSTLKKFVAAAIVVETDGVFSLVRQVDQPHAALRFNAAHAK